MELTGEFSWSCSEMGTAEIAKSLGAVCRDNLLEAKWLIAPSLAVGHQWIEALLRSGQSIVHLQPTTISRLALEIEGPELAAKGLVLAPAAIGPLIVDSTWKTLDPNGYFGRLRQSPALSAAIYQSLLSLRLAGLHADEITESTLENAAKAKDVFLLLRHYEAVLSKEALVDEADVLRRAIARLNSQADAIDRNSLILIPAGLEMRGLESQFLKALPDSQRISISHPIEAAKSASSAVRVLATIGQTEHPAIGPLDGTVRFFRSVGEVNEIREVLRRCLSERIPLDEIELLHTDTDTYVPLIYATARRYAFEPNQSEGIPVTFAEGIPASLSRPGRALAAWLHWIDENYSQHLLVEMIGDGLIDCGNESIRFGQLVRLLRPIAIGFGADHYLPKLDEHIKALQTSPRRKLDSDGDEILAASRDFKLKGLEVLRKSIKQLLRISSNFASGSSAAVLNAAEEFLSSCARSVTELDHSSRKQLIEQLRGRRDWLQRLGVIPNLSSWIQELPAETQVMGSGPRPGHIHVAHIGSGGHSGRRQTFVVGLDDRRFPGAALQDPILLDRERKKLGGGLSTSAERLRQKYRDLATMLSRLSGSVTMSWSCHDLSDDRETFPSSVILSAYRLTSGQHESDLEALNTAVGSPISFAPTSAEKALDESERWLWQLSQQAFRDSDQTAAVECRFAHLARGNAAQRQRFREFGPFNGYVPKAGEALDPFKKDTGPVLSASALETAGRCPLAYFFRSGLGLYPVDEMEIEQDRWLDPAQFGLLLHDVFRQVMSELTREGKRPEFERDHSRIAAILKDKVEQWGSAVPPPNENAFRTQYWRLIRTTRIFLQVEEDFCRQSQPRYFEVAIGLENVAGGSPLDQADPSTVVLPSGRAIRVRGQIDRIDELGDGKYAVWDYKVGSGYGYDRADPFRAGRRVQSILYLRMVESALRKQLDPDAAVDQFGYFFPSVQSHGLRIHWEANALAGGVNILEQLGSMIAGGAFPPTDLIDDCRYCDYLGICRDVDRVTKHGRELLERTDLVPLLPLRELRRA